ncbi:MAG TPA: hypothetical protein VD907_03255 [Verrucomicrobiae bacterium]|nr:hypothetical protein [Verrucomicrobiae bacterium]
MNSDALASALWSGVKNQWPGITLDQFKDAVKTAHREMNETQEKSTLGDMDKRIMAILIERHGLPVNQNDEG